MLDGFRLTIRRLEQRLPEPVVRYGLPLASLIALTIITWFSYSVLGLKVRLFYELLVVLYFLVMLGSAWIGYGPGVLVCGIITMALPHLRPNNRRPTADLTAFALLLIISLLVSRLSQTRRRREEELRRIAEDLEIRVRERTEEALRSAAAARETEERLRFVLDSAQIGYWDYDVLQNDTTRSRKYDELFGYEQPLPRWSRDTFLEHVHPEDRETAAEHYRQALQHGQDSREFRIVWPDQTVRWVWLQCRVRRDPSGTAEHLSGVIMDVTERRRSADSLREHAQLLDLAHDAILSLDRNAAITFWSRGAERMYGWTGEEVLGKPVHAMLQTILPEPRHEIERRALATGFWEGELTHTRRDGAQLRVASRWALRKDPEGRPCGFLEINSDITERRQIEEQLRHTQKLESLGVLAGGIAHDFNNLLTGVLGNASLAMDGLFHRSREHLLLEAITKAAERAADLTRQLLAYAGKGRFIMRTLNLSELVRDISALVQTSIPRQVDLKLQLAEGLPGVEADPGQLQQIVMNLVINAAEAIGPEGGSVLVRTGVQQVDAQYIATLAAAHQFLRPGEYVSLDIDDTGCGMSDETLARIFDPFFTTKFAGRGLGLSAVLGIVRSHYGALKVSSRPGKGTSFKVLFPVSASRVATPAAKAPGEWKGTGTILVVDDEETVRLTASRTLESYGYDTRIAVNGAEAVEIFRRRPEAIGLVLLDLTMPVMGGEEALRRMQAIEPRVRVLLTSGYSEVEAIQRFAGKGLAGFIQKPYTAGALAEKVRDLIFGSAGMGMSQVARP